MHMLSLLPVFALSLTQATKAEPAPEADPAPTEEVVAEPVPKAPRHKGTGLLATTGILGGTSLVVTIARNALLRKNCPLDDGTAVRCHYDFGSDIGLAATQWSVNFAMVGFAPGAGYTLGRYHAWKDSTTGKQRNIKAIMGGGGGLLGAGVLGLGTSIALAFVLPARCVDKELESGDPLAGDRCLLRAYPGWTMMNWASFAMIGSGSAMLAYGSAYKKGQAFRSARLQLSPQLGRSYAGVGVSGQF
jgi:hypothetical protein